MRNLILWKALWILISIAYLVLIIIWPTIMFLSHDRMSHQEIVEAMSLQAQEIISRKPAVASIYSESDVVFFNGDKTTIYGTQGEKEYVKGEYYKTSDRITGKKRLRHIIFTVLAWVLPCTLMYALGYGIDRLFENSGIRITPLRTHRAQSLRHAEEIDNPNNIF